MSRKQALTGKGGGSTEVWRQWSWSSRCMVSWSMRPMCLSVNLVFCSCISTRNCTQLKSGGKKRKLIGEKKSEKKERWKEREKGRREKEKERRKVIALRWMKELNDGWNGSVTDE